MIVMACGAASEAPPPPGGIAAPVSATVSTQQVPLSGAYALIDTKQDLVAITALRTGSPEERARVAGEVISHPDRHSPAVFFSLAAHLSDKGETDSAIFWMYAGRIRTQYDIRRSTDKTVEDAGRVLGRQIPDILKLLQFENLENAKVLVSKAVEWDRATPYNYDPRWIALHGLGPSLPDADKTLSDSLTVPRETWPALAEENRKEYLAGFLEDVAAFTPEQLSQISEKLEELRSAETLTAPK